MADNLLQSGLAWLQDPRRTQQLQQVGGLFSSGISNLQKSKAEYDALQAMAFADPRNPLKITDQNAFNRLAEMAQAGPLSFAPLGMTKNFTELPSEIPGVFGQRNSTTKDELRNLADLFAEEIRKLGFNAKVEHSGSKVGASSYINVADPETGRFLDKPLRISDHSKGPKESQGVINISDPQSDFEKIKSILENMRMQGPSLVMRQEKYAQELISNGVKPSTAYQKARNEVIDVQKSNFSPLLQDKVNSTPTNPFYQDPFGNPFAETIR